MKINLGCFQICFYKKPKRTYTNDELVTIKMTKDQLRKKVTGAIKCACDNHPQIPRDMIGSISKRVVGTIIGVDGIPEHMIEEAQ